MLIACLIAGLLLSMNTATMDGSRALYGISQDGMTTKWLGRLNSYSVPGIAMTLDVILNLFLISYFGYPLDILAAGNLGYMLAHVFALSGFLLLRRDRPNWPRPIKLAAAWMPIAALLAAVNLLFIVAGGFIYADKYGYGWDKTWIGIGVLAVGLLLYIWRHVVEDRSGSGCARRRRRCRPTASRQRPRRRRGLASRSGCGRSSHFGSSAIALR